MAVLESQKLRCQQFLREGTESALNQAVDAAHSCLELDETLECGFLMLTEALSRLRRHEQAVAWYKQGLKLHPDNAKLQLGLNEARVAVLNNLLEESDEEEDERSTLLPTTKSNQGTTNDCLDISSRKMKPTTEKSPLRTMEIVQRAQAYATADNGETLINEFGGTVMQEGGSKEMQSAMFRAKVERILEHLDVRKLARMTVIYISADLLKLRRVTVGIGLLFFGLLAQAIMHRQILMVISMLIICFYRSQLKKRALRYAQDWMQTSKDKLGAFGWIPHIVFVIPIYMKVFGQLKFMLFLQQDMHLAGFVLIVTAILVANASRTNAGQQARLWGKGRQLKFAAYFTTTAYWVVWRGQWTDFTRLLGPALIDAGGIVLGSVSSNELQIVYRRAFIKLYNDVANDIQSNVDLDAWFFFGLSSWLIEYWQQPTDFSLEMLFKMLTECFDAMEKAAVQTFNPELRHLQNQVKNMKITDELHLLVLYLKQSLEAVPPARLFGITVLFAKCCPSFVVFSLLVALYGVISLSLLPFVVSESQDAKKLYDRYRTNKLQGMDGFELMLLDSPLFNVWKNVKNCIYCLDGSFTFSKAVATGTHLVSAAARISRLAVFASRLKKEGVFANAHDIPDHIANVFLVTKDSSLIVDGVRYLRNSTHFQDLQTSIVNWWSGERP